LTATLAVNNAGTRIANARAGAVHPDEQALLNEVKQYILQLFTPTHGEPIMRRRREIEVQVYSQGNYAQGLELAKRAFYSLLARGELVLGGRWHYNPGQPKPLYMLASDLQTLPKAHLL